MYAKFGTAGCCEAFYDAGNKSALEMPQWIKEHSLDCFEYQCGHGVKISEDAAKILGRRASESDVALSVHAPYYISLSSAEKEKRDNSISYIMQTLKAADIMGADRIVVHSGSCGKMTRREALSLAMDTVRRAIDTADNSGYGDISICPEAMGKVKQLGTVEEVIKICQLDERLIPTLDFGHINAMTLGGLKTKAEVEAVFDAIENKLGSYRAKNLHAHYSRIEYTNAGEKKHRTYGETEFEPDFEPIGQVIAERGYTPRIICESAGTQTADAVEIKTLYKSFLQGV